MKNIRHDTDEAQATLPYDLFNGDADGLCSLLQLRLAKPSDAELITGTKREIELFRFLPDDKSLSVTALDISFDKNRDYVHQVLQNGGSVRYFDHHAAHSLFVHPNLETHINTGRDFCTSLLVDLYLNGEYRPWAITGVFGDNLNTLGAEIAYRIGLSQAETSLLRRLGELLNYNSYGETVEDLHQHPAALYKELCNFDHPLDFVSKSLEFKRLNDGFEVDRSRSSGVNPHWQDTHVLIYLLPHASWARRMSGTIANELSRLSNSKSVAVITPRVNGDYSVSIRLTPSCKIGADVYCSRYPSGGGRHAAGGINQLASDEISKFIASFSHFVKLSQN